MPPTSPLSALLERIRWSISIHRRALVISLTAVVLAAVAAASFVALHSGGNTPDERAAALAGPSAAAKATKPGAANGAASPGPSGKTGSGADGQSPAGTGSAGTPGGGNTTGGTGQPGSGTTGQPGSGTGRSGTGLPGGLSNRIGEPAPNTTAAPFFDFANPAAGAISTDHSENGPLCTKVSGILYDMLAKHTPAEVKASASLISDFPGTRNDIARLCSPARTQQMYDMIIRWNNGQGLGAHP